MIKLNEHLKRMVVKASIMNYSIETVHQMIDEILTKYGVKDISPVDIYISKKIGG